jgi:hypothetical protein
MKNQQEYKDLSSLYEEGVLSRAGARVAGVKAAAGQYAKNIGSTLVGRSAPVSAGEAGKTAKLEYAFNAAAKNLLNDLQKLNLLPKGQPGPSTIRQIQSVLGTLVTKLQQSSSSATPPAPAVSSTPSPASSPGFTPVGSSGAIHRKVY